MKEVGDFDLVVICFYNSNTHEYLILKIFAVIVLFMFHDLKKLK